MARLVALAGIGVLDIGEVEEEDWVGVGPSRIPEKKPSSIIIVAKNTNLNYLWISSWVALKSIIDQVVKSIDWISFAECILQWKPFIFSLLQTQVMITRRCIQATK